MFDVSNAKHLDDALPHSKLEILPEAGHLAWSAQPEMLASMVTDWVNSDHKMVYSISKPGVRLPMCGISPNRHCCTNW